jgi:catechol 2,3-dioxygenase-like lactoylglutathione lyase family enzyme
MTSRLDAWCIVARDPERLADFWATVLGRTVSADLLLVGRDGEVPLRFREGDVRKVGANQVHPHLTSTSLADQQDVVRRVLELGGQHLDVGQLPEEEHVVLADPEGNELCVIEPGNSFLAGCGFLAELACDGTAAVGRFWSEALGWPLVWDQDEETAIQSPHGGTKIAWGGPPLTAPTRRSRFELVAEGSLDAEVERLVSLGATVVPSAGDASYVVLTDPDGVELVLLG